MIQTFQVLIDRMTYHADANRIPLTGSFELTARCNLHCGMCFICNAPEARKSELSAAQWLDIMTQARDEGMLFALLTGGEVFVLDNFWDIYTGAKRLGLYITINSNGTTITPEIADMLVRYPPVRLTITIYGASEEGYRRVTGSGDAYRKMLRGLELLEERGIEYRLRTTLTKDTSVEIGEITKLILSYGQQMSYTNYIMPGVLDNGNDVLSQRLSPEEAAIATKQIHRAIQEYYDEHGRPGVEEYRRFLEKYNADRQIPLDPEQERMHKISLDRRKNTAFYCQAGRSHFWVSYNGRLSICGLSREPSVDLLKTPFRSAFDELGKAVEEIPLCEDCKSCEHRYVCSPCPAKLYGETGRYDQKAEYLCSFAESNLMLRE